MVYITSDSTADIGEEAQKRDIKIVPLKVLLGNDTYLDGINITPEQIFSFVETKKIMPKTSAPSIEDYREFFETLIDGGNEVVHIALSSKVSASCQCAKNVAKEFDGKVRVVDTFALSTGQGLLALKAADLRDEGKTAEEIETAITALTDKVNTSFIPDRLDYLYKGGRCSRLEMYGANLLRIHPMISMKDGGLFVKRKYRGRMVGCIKEYIGDLKKDYPEYDKTRCFVTHSNADEELVQTAVNEVKEKFGFAEVIVTKAGSVITGHCGRNTLGVLFVFA